MQAMRGLSALIQYAAPTALALLTTACGGSVSFGFGSFNEFDESPPSINVVASASSVQAGQSVQLMAAAADESGIDSVAFYRMDGSTVVLLGTDGFEPYEWLASAPTDGRTLLTVFARARDNAGNLADSNTVTITVTP